MAQVDEAITGYPASSLFSDVLHYLRRTPASPRVLTRLNLKTVECEQVADLSACPQTRWPVAVVSPDDRHWVGNYRASCRVRGLYRANLRTGAWEPFH